MQHGGAPAPATTLLSALPPVELTPAALRPIDWLQLLHPVLMILFVYPVVGATIRLGILVREKRLEINPIAATVPAEHADHGRWVTTGSVVAVLLALAANLARSGATEMAPGLPLAAILAMAGCLGLWRVRRAAWRAVCALLSWGALALLLLQPPLWFRGQSPSSTILGSHAWSGWLLIGLFLFAMASAPEIRSSATWRRLHTAAAVLAALLLAVQAISGSRDLLLLNLA
ncbi:MAG: DUF4079 domain-containing protein [Synechococcaceae cyanobacterium]|nr:DUF4079 domain-containing protein [Synechococcaceae cyanobacterium]